MARNLHYSLSILLSSVFVLAFSWNVYTIDARHKPKLRGMFVFGATVVDNGNNNNNKIVRANYLPYGIDFPKGPTGRFTNGKNVADHITDLLGLPPVTPFLDIRYNRSELVKPSGLVPGVNFAMSASGILLESSILMGVKSLGQQIKSFKNLILPQLEDKLERSKESILADYLFMVAVGNRDYLHYYFNRQDQNWSELVFTAKLVSNYFGEIKTLYSLGARKFLLLSVYPIGCDPALRKNGKCIQKLNEAAEMYYEQLQLMVMQSQHELLDAQFCLVNSAKIITDTFKSANKTGFKNIDSPCCETSMFGRCKKGGRVCPNRKEYFYFDGYNLSEAASRILACKAYQSTDDNEAYPESLKDLIAGDASHE